MSASTGREASLARGRAERERVRLMRAMCQHIRTAQNEVRWILKNVPDLNKQIPDATATLTEAEQLLSYLHFRHYDIPAIDGRLE